MVADKHEGITISWVKHFKESLADADNPSPVRQTMAALLLASVVFSTKPVVSGTTASALQTGLETGLVIDAFRLHSTPAASGPHDFSPVIGRPRHTVVRPDDTLHTIALRSGAGLAELRLANPQLDTWLPDAGAPVVLPTQHVLPAALRKPATTKTTVVVNLPEFRLYLQTHNRVMTYPISIGKAGFATPQLVSRVTEKRRNPVWRPTDSIRREANKRGEKLPREVLPGPDNPLGKYAIRLGSSAYLIHGTNRPSGLGLRVSHGCIRMFPADIEHVYSQIARGDGVVIVNEPVKVGWRDGKLWMEVHPPLDEFPLDDEALLSRALELAFGQLLHQGGDLAQQRLNVDASVTDTEIAELADTKTHVWLDDKVVREAVRTRNGLPVVVSQSGEFNIRSSSLNQ